MADTDKITITLKADGAPWVVLHADSPEEADELLEAVATLQPKVVEAALSFRSSGAPVSSTRSNGYNRSGPQSSAGGGNSQAGSGDVVTFKVPFDQKDAFKAQFPQARWNGDKKGWNVPTDAPGVADVPYPRI